MKYKLFSSGYWIQLLVLIPVFTFGSCVAAYAAYDGPQNERFLMWLVLIPYLGYLLYLFIRRKDYFSWVYIEDSGIRAICFGKIWFETGWKNLEYIGTFRRTLAKGHQNWIYFSKMPIDLDEAEIYGVAPINSSLDGNGIFMETNEKSLNHISQYVGQERLASCKSFKI